MKKTLLTLSMLLLMFAAIAQNQISELQKGMVFHWAGNEWYPTKDLVSGTNGTATAVYNISDKQGGGNNRYFSFNGTSDYITLPTLSAFGSADFSITGKIKTGSIGAVRTIIGGVTNSFELYISATGYLTAIKNGGSALTASTTLLAANTEYTFAYVRSSTTGTYYVNGTVAGTCTDSNNYSVECTLLGKGTGYFSGYQFMVRAFNYALSSVVNYSKPEYPIEYSDRDGAGNLCVLDLNSSGLARASDGSYNTGYWTDRTNSITATVSGATSVIPPASCLGGTWFNGTSSKISFIPSAQLMASTEGTISIWFYALSLSSASAIFGFGDANVNEFLFLETQANGQLIFYVYDAGASKFDMRSSVGTVNINGWNNIIITNNRTIPKWYLNGTSISYTSTASNYGYWLSDLTGVDNFKIGAIEAGGATAEFFNGLLSGCSIWSRILSQDEIKLLYDLGH